MNSLCHVREGSRRIGLACVYLQNHSESLILRRRGFPTIVGSLGVLLIGTTYTDY